MAVKWHPKKDGTGVSKCDARKQTCPNGGDAEHFATKKEALTYVEAQAAQENEANGSGSLPSAITKPSSKESLSSGSLDPEKLEREREEVNQMHPGLRKDAARSEGSSVEMLSVLAKDGHWVVRAGVASNTNASRELLTVLGSDGDNVVRSRVAQNKNTPVGVLATIAKDKNYWVREYVAQNPSTDPDVLVALSDDTDEDVSEAAMRNPSLPLSRILELAHHRHYHQRIRIVDNLSLPYEDLLLMLSDRSKKVRQRAEEALRKRNGSVRLD